MKRRPLHTLLASAAALTVATTFVACDKKTADQTAPPAGNSTAPAAPAKPGDAAAKPVEAAKSLVKEVAAAVAPVNVAAIRDSYGIAAMLTKDVEAFGANYRLHDLWVKLSDSKWAATLINLPALKNEPKFQQFLQQWNSPQAAKAKELVESLLGVEIAGVYSAGFTDKLIPWIDLFSELQGLQMQRAFMTAMSGGQPPDSQKLLRDAAPELIPAIAKCDVPPFFLAYKAVKSKADIEGGIGMATTMLAMRLPPGVELGKFKLADKYEFQNITLDAAKFIAAVQEEMVRGQLAEMLGDEGKAKLTLEMLKKKKIEIAWGWVGDYLILSIGTDHAHVKFAASDADSALALPAVARRGAEFAARKPLSLGYASAGMLEKIQGKIEFADAFRKLSDELAGLLKPEHIKAMQEDVKKFEGRVQKLVTTTFDPLISVSYLEGGIHAEMFGGARQTALDTSKPLGFASLLSQSAFVFADSRCNPAHDGKTADLIEDGVTILWGWYEKYGRTMVPEDERQGAQMVEMMAVPMIKDVWGASRKLARALGSESAFILDLNGPMPTFPNMPPALAEGKVPRLAWVAELKDRAGLSDAWTGFSKVIKQIAAFVPGAAAIPEPTMKKEGDAEIHFIEPPLTAGDFLPHIAISKDRWIISSSPSLTKTITAQTSATGGSPLGGEVLLQIPAACDLAEAWLKLVDKDPAFFFHGSHDQKEYATLRPTFGELLKLGRSIQSLGVRIFSEGSEARNSVFLKLEDVK